MAICQICLAQIRDADLNRQYHETAKTMSQLSRRRTAMKSNEELCQEWAEYLEMLEPGEKSMSYQQWREDYYSRQIDRAMDRRKERI